ncbi:MAG: NAD(P)-binding protein [Sphingobium sp.]|nr:NAD(P)-binding protein [Sphingobium sp.]MBP6110806.1 NAD(P)-binding protein [Sphingobium sp.]MBP9157494.1 NAD(P)-binding protein [Sphingobium sp.]
MNAQDIIIGSGPSGYAAAVALAARGRDVLILDAGLTMDADAQELRARMGSAEPDQWQTGDRDAIGAVRRSEKSDSIRPFGSDYLFHLPDELADFGEVDGVHGLKPSFALGGLSNGWGASVLPYHASDFEGWPISLADLAPHYAAIAPLIGMAAARDGLADFYDGVAIAEGRSLPQSRQAQELLTHMDRNRASFAQMGVHFGASRQAIAPGCRACAMCLYGCPYRLIFNAGDAVERMAAAGTLRYQGGVIVRRFAEHADGVSIHTSAGKYDAERLFIAGGVLPSTRLVLGSLDLHHEVTIRDSQHFYLPMLHRWKAGDDPATEPRHTLAQAFWAIDDPAVDAHVVHAQLYTYNDTYAPDMRARFGPFAKMAKPLIEALSRRLIVAQPFLHSDASPAIGARIAGGRLFTRRIDNARTAAAIQRVKRRIAKAAWAAGLMPLTPLLRTGTLGSSFHCGGSFPMHHSPSPGETDSLGRLKGQKRTYIVDASVLPTIPAPTITFSVMANAHRIASEA